MALQAGDQLLGGKYRIAKQIGRGGFGSVYLALDPLLGRQVAMKELLTAVVDDPTLVKRFVAEARVALSLRHPNIVEVYDIFSEGGNYYIAMEYLCGGSLQHWLRSRGSLSTDEALRIMQQVCAGLAHAHHQGVVHCDVKPANILFAGDGTAKITDFGIAHISLDTMTRAWRTATQFTAGTLNYMSPEQLEGVRDDPRVDVYALGAVLYEMLAGRPYLNFETGSTPAAQMRNMQRIAEQPARPLPSRVPAWLATVVMKALGKRLESRYSHAGKLGEALQATEAPTIQVGPSLASLEMVGRRAADAEPARRRTLAPRPRARGMPDRFWPAVGGGAAMLVLVLVVATFAALGGGRPASPPTPLPPAPTATHTPEPSPAPTGTPVPTDALVPPANTPTPTNTPLPPTETPIPPTPTATVPPATPTPVLEPVTAVVDWAEEVRRATVDAHRPVIAHWRWLVCQPQVVQEWLDTLTFEVTIDGRLTDTGNMAQHREGVREEDLYGRHWWVLYWSYPVGAFESGSFHWLEVEFHVIRSVTSGCDFDGDGHLDMVEAGLQGVTRLELTVQ